MLSYILKLFKITSLVAIPIIICSCSQNQSSSSKANSSGNVPNKTVINIDIGAEPPNLDPQLIEDANATRVANDLFQGLVTLDQNNSIINGLAKSWEISSDGLTYIFTLRDNIRFSDNTPITVDDFIYSWQRLVDPKTGATYSYIADSIKNATKITNNQLPVNTLGVTKINQNTLKVSLEHPDNDFLAKLTLPAFSVVAKKTVEKYGRAWIDPKNITTSGAYSLKNHIVNGSISLVKNPYYYNANEVKIPTVKFYPLVDTNNSLSKYKNNELEMTWSIPVDQFKSIKEDFSTQLHVTPIEGIVYYDINMLRPEFKDIRLRQALNLAVDREILTKEVLGTGVVPNYSNATNSVANGKYKNSAYNWASWPRQKQIAQAQKLYQQAGYNKNHPLNLTISYYTDDEQKKVALAIASMWKTNLGINVKITNQEWKSFLQSRLTGNYQIAADRWFADYNGISTYLNYFTCDSTQNRVKLCNKAFDNYLSIANSANNQANALKYYTMALNTLQSQYATIPLYQLVSKRLVKPYVKGYTPETNHLDLVYSEWFHY